MQERIEVDIKIPNQTKYLGLIGRIGENLAHSLVHYAGDRDELAYHLNLVLTEALTNAIRHANAEDPSKEVQVTITISAHNLTIEVFDQGQGFDFSNLSKSEINETAERGRGIQIIHRLMDQVEYRKVKKGHVLKMTKTFQ